MHDQISPARQDDASDRTVIDALIDDPGPWAVVELQREFLNPLTVEDCLNRLAGRGFVHRFDGFVFASRTAREAADIFEG